jgi:Flp pilus assembly protein TadD
MPLVVPQVRSPMRKLRALATICTLALASAGCLGRSAEMTGSIPDGPDAARMKAEAARARYDSKPNDPAVAIAYASSLRGLDQKPQALAVLQQATIRNPNNHELLAAYGKALADVGRYTEAAEVLGRAHLPERPDWRILSAQGTVADQMGDHALAQRYYDAALKIAPTEPETLSNLGLSYALSKRLGDAEPLLRQAADHPKADSRIRQNLALVLGLKGNFAEAEEVLRRDLTQAEAAENLRVMKSLVAQQNSWKALRRAESGKSQPPAPNG